MSSMLDIGLVITVVAAAAAYLIMRKVRGLKKVNRDWATGHAEVCDHCPAMKIREAQVKALARRG
jgi:hypothetical protein